MIVSPSVLSVKNALRRHCRGGGVSVKKIARMTDAAGGGFLGKKRLNSRENWIM